MKIHADKLTASDIYKAAPDRTYVELTERGSRKRKRAFDVGLSASHGDDAHGLARVYSRNTGRTGAMGDYDRAATWIEWGDWMVELFKIDPAAVIGNYDGAHDFVVQTQAAAPHRPARENAEFHADRWSEELFWHQAKEQGQVKITRVLNTNER